MNKSTSILLVDARPEVRRRYSGLLREQGYQVWEAATGREGLRLAREQRPGLVLLDGELPDLGAEEVCRRIKADAALPDVFVFLALAEPPTAPPTADESETAPDGYFPTRLSAAEFLARIRTVVRLWERSAALRARYRSIFENATEGIFQTTPAGRYHRANPALARILGYQTPAELISSVTDIGRQVYVVPKKRQELKRLLETQGRVRDFESEHYCKDRTRIWVRVNAHVVRDAAGGVLYFEGTMQDVTERKRTEEELRNLSRRLSEVQEAEHRRVARELHDGVNQILASVKMRLHRVQRMVAALSPAAREILARCDGMLGEALEENSRIAHNLHPGALQELGLAAACRALCEELKSRTPLVTRCRVAPGPQPLSPVVELNLFRIVQEALTNVEKHARATAVWLRIAPQGGSIRLSVRDNGRGFDPQRKQRPRGHERGTGLANMRERVLSIGGTCEVHSAPGKGTVITARVPLAKPA